jgi:hypothetical protein
MLTVDRTMLAIITGRRSLRIILKSFCNREIWKSELEKA